MDENKQVEAAPSVPQKSAGAGKKILIIGLPLFIVQLVAVYFITANILINRIQMNANAQTAGAQNKEQAKKADEPKVELGKFIYSIDDIITNPADTDGKKVLLLSVAFDVSSDKDKKTLEEKQVLIKDAVSSTVAAKTIPQLNNIAFRDTLRSEIVKQIGKMITDVKINRVYFSKYIIN